MWPLSSTHVQSIALMLPVTLPVVKAVTSSEVFPSRLSIIHSIVSKLSNWPFNTLTLTFCSFPGSPREGDKESTAEKVTSSSDATLVSGTTESIALRKIPVYLKNGGRRLRVNALLDDASTKTYINSDVAAEMGLHAFTINLSFF